MGNFLLLRMKVWRIQCKKMVRYRKKNICKTPSTLALKITKDIYFLFWKTLGKPTAFTFQFSVSAVLKFCCYIFYVIFLCSTSSNLLQGEKNLVTANQFVWFGRARRFQSRIVWKNGKLLKTLNLRYEDCTSILGARHFRKPLSPS